MFDEMLTAGVKPTIVTYTSLARPWARRGDFARVEEIQRQLVKRGLVPNDYFLNVLLSAYTRANPRQKDKAEAAIREAWSRGVEVNEIVVASLERCVGRERYKVLQAELGLCAPKPPSHSAQNNFAKMRTGGARHVVDSPPRKGP